MHLGTGTVRLSSGTMENYVRMNQGTIATLELINPLPGSRMQKAECASLFQLLNRTKTKLGARLESPVCCSPRIQHQVQHSVSLMQGMLSLGTVKF